jgi:FkbM family methyltransferase
MLEFKYKSYNVLCPEIYFPFVKEVFIFDVYRSSLLNKGDLVIDLGASTGDFSILASHKVGEKGRVIAIEPDPESYQILKMNIQRNRCNNVIPVNSAVSGGHEELSITFRNKSFTSKAEALTDILYKLNINDAKVNFIKIDIEGYEAEAIKHSIEIFKRCNVIAIECHGYGTKEKIDSLLLPHGFSFDPLTMSHIYRRILSTLFFHPLVLHKSFIRTIVENPCLISQFITGFETTKDRLINGVYIRNN